jgi:hypothetical protein
MAEIMAFIFGAFLATILLWLRMSNANHKLSRENEALHGKLAEHRIITDGHKREIRAMETACSDLIEDTRAEYGKLVEELVSDLKSARKRLERFDRPRVNGRFVKRKVTRDEELAIRLPVQGFVKRVKE